MDYFSPGVRELTRKLGRLLNRLRSATERRRLAQAETELGLLGWQQADYDPETQREVDKIQNYEREQSRLTNESAEIAGAIRILREERDAARKEYDEARRQIDAGRRAITEPLQEEEKKLTTSQRQEPHFQKRMPELDREQRDVTKLYNELLGSQNQTAVVRQEIARLRDRTMEISNEKADLRTQHMRLVSDIKTLEKALKQRRDSLSAADQQLKELDAAFQIADRDRVAELKVRDREKLRVEKEVDALEIAKANPYQQIGRVLADSNLAPVNQPQALEKVRRQRFTLGQLEYEFSRSLQISGEADASIVQISYLLWAVMTFVACLMAGLLLRG